MIQGVLTNRYLISVLFLGISFVALEAKFDLNKVTLRANNLEARLTEQDEDIKLLKRALVDQLRISAVMNNLKEAQWKN